MRPRCTRGGSRLWPGRRSEYHGVRPAAGPAVPPSRTPVATLTCHPRSRTGTCQRFPCPAARALRRFLPAAALLALAPAPSAPRRRAATSRPARPRTRVRVCLTAPADGATLTGDTTVTRHRDGRGRNQPGRAAGRVLARRPVPADRLHGAVHVHAADQRSSSTARACWPPSALMRDGTTTAPQTPRSRRTFSTGTTTPPVNPNTFAPKVANPPPEHLAGRRRGRRRRRRRAGAADVVHLISAGTRRCSSTSATSTRRARSRSTPTGSGRAARSSVYYGRLKPITDPTIGNHEYNGGQAPGLLRLLGQRPALLQLQLGLAGTSSASTPTPRSARPRRARRSTQWLQHDLQQHQAVHARLLPPAAVQHRPGGPDHVAGRHLVAARVPGRRPRRQRPRPHLPALAAAGRQREPEPDRRDGDHRRHGRPRARPAGRPPTAGSSRRTTRITARSGST